DGLPFGVAKGFDVEPSGDSGVVALEPGRYRVFVSHGPEFSLDELDVAIAPGETTEIRAQLARVIDTAGFVAGDFHVHSIDSPDAPTSRRNRVRSMLAGG